LVTVVGALAFAAPASATLYVDDTGDDTANNCAAPPSPCQTIAHAISQAGAGDLIKVAPGLYNESQIQVNKSVHLEGAAAGIDARGRNIAESEVVHGFSVTEPDVSIDGFFVHGGGAASDHEGVLLWQHGYRVVNDIVSGFDAGVVLTTDNPVTGVVIRHNDIHDNNAGAVQTAIFALGGAQDVEIDANRLANQTYNSIAIEGGYSSNVSITGNTIANGGPLVLHNVHDSEVSGNSIVGSSDKSIDLAGADSDIRVAGNIVSGSAAAALSLEEQPDRSPIQGVGISTFPAPDSGIAADGNDLSGNNGAGVAITSPALAASGGTSAAMTAHFNRIVGNTGAGIQNASPGSVDARNNWWGCNGGPNTPGCETMSGNNISADRWLALAATAERGRILANGDTNRISAGFGVSIGASTLEAVDPSELPPITVAFPAATLGTVSPAPTKTSGGIAQTLYTAGVTAGQGNVTASADSQSVTTSNFTLSSDAGPQGPAGSAGPAGPAADPAQPHPVVIRSSSLRATKQRMIKVGITCPNASGMCDGRLAIGAGSTTLGNTRFLVRGGSRATIKIKGSANAIKKAVRRKKVTVIAFSRDNAGTATLTTKSVKFRG
jgi:hypothetical protein